MTFDLWFSLNTKHHHHSALLGSMYINKWPHHPLHTLTSQAMDVVDGRRAPFPPHHYSSGGDTRDTDTQAPSSGECSPLPRPCSSDHLHSPDGSPCSAEEIDKGVTLFDRGSSNVQLCIKGKVHCFDTPKSVQFLSADMCMKLYKAFVWLQRELRKISSDVFWISIGWGWRLHGFENEKTGLERILNSTYFSLGYYLVICYFHKSQSDDLSYLDCSSFFKNIDKEM